MQLPCALLLAMVAACTLPAALGAPNYPIRSATVYGTPDNMKVDYKLDCDAAAAIACGSHVVAYNTSGWGRLHINASASAPAVDGAYGVGYIEGVLTQHEIYMAFTNYFIQFFGRDAQNPAIPATPSTDIVNFVNQNYEWVEAKTAEAASSDPYWAAVEAVMAQYRGMMDGYLAVAPEAEKLTEFHFRCLQLDGDMETIQQLFQTESTADATAVAPGLRGSAVKPHISLEERFSHCSVCIRATSETMFLGHDTWDGFEALLRMFKHYKLTIPHPTGGETKQTLVTLSSTPGYLSSVDDFYVTSRGIYVTETTNGLYNNTLLEQVKPTGVVFSWLRCMVATYTAESGEEWANTFGMFNSGTYNNQWMVVTLDKFDKGTMQDGLLWVVEQLPGQMVGADQTDALRTDGYWGSYNIPFYPEVYKASGFAEQFSKHGNSFSHEHCPRANIFRRDAPKVETLDDYKTMMQYNDWQHDPLQLGSAANGIMSRYDLLATGADAFGGIDSKVMDLAMARMNVVDAMNGPTHVQQTPYEWTARWDSHSHLGQAPRFDFTYDTMTPMVPMEA